MITVIAQHLLSCKSPYHQYYGVGGVVGEIVDLHVMPVCQAYTDHESIISVALDRYLLYAAQESPSNLNLLS